MVSKIQNKQSSEWLTVKKFAESKIQLLHLELEGNKDENQTALIRGKISFARELLRLGDDKKADEVITVSYD